MTSNDRVGQVVCFPIASPRRRDRPVGRVDHGGVTTPRVWDGKTPCELRGEIVILGASVGDRVLSAVVSLFLLVAIVDESLG